MEFHTSIAAKKAGVFHKTLIATHDMDSKETAAKAI